MNLDLKLFADKVNIKFSKKVQMIIYRDAYVIWSRRVIKNCEHSKNCSVQCTNMRVQSRIVLWEYINENCALKVQTRTVLWKYKRELCPKRTNIRELFSESTNKRELCSGSTTVLWEYKRELCSERIKNNQEYNKNFALRYTYKYIHNVNPARRGNLAHHCI